jgi:hypothetical protein|tara:strand:- start:861 stop:1070 length:210 start_codon:yes stop_codon:yes gene_type:complete
MKYKVKYWISVDFLAEEIIEADDFNAQSFNQGKYSDPSKNASYIVNDTIKITRRTFEEYDEKLNNSIKE